MGWTTPGVYVRGSGVEGPDLSFVRWVISLSLPGTDVTDTRRESSRFNEIVDNRPLKYNIGGCTDAKYKFALRFNEGVRIS